MQLCEGDSLGPEREKAAAAWLARLYAGGLSLPMVGMEYADDFPVLPESAVGRARANLACFNGDYYREYFNPSPLLNDESCMGDIGDDLMDIYLDIKRGCVMFERMQIQAALWHWSYNHRAHWGRHTVGALFALHCFYLSS